MYLATVWYLDLTLSQQTGALGLSEATNYWQLDNTLCSRELNLYPYMYPATVWYLNINATFHSLFVFWFGFFGYSLFCLKILLWNKDVMKHWQGMEDVSRHWQCGGCQQTVTVVKSDSEWRMTDIQVPNSSSKVILFSYFKNYTCIGIVLHQNHLNTVSNNGLWYKKT